MIDFWQICLSSLVYVVACPYIKNNTIAFDQFVPQHWHRHTHKHSQNNMEHTLHLTWLGFTEIRFEFMKIGSPGLVA